MERVFIPLALLEASKFCTSLRVALSFQSFKPSLDPCFPTLHPASAWHEAFSHRAQNQQLAKDPELSTPVGV
jgi:hypothetical protein